MMEEKIIEMSQAEADAFMEKIKAKQPNGVVTFGVFGNIKPSGYQSVCVDGQTIHIKIK